MKKKEKKITSKPKQTKLKKKDAEVFFNSIKNKLAKSIRKKVGGELSDRFSDLKDDAYGEINSFERSVLEDLNKWYKKKTRHILYYAGAATILIILVLGLASILMVNKVNDRVNKAYAVQTKSLEVYVNRLENKLDSIASSRGEIIEQRVKEEIQGDEFKSFAEEVIEDKTTQLAYPIINTKSNKLIKESEMQIMTYLDSLAKKY